MNSLRLSRSFVLGATLGLAVCTIAATRGVHAAPVAASAPAAARAMYYTVPITQADLAGRTLRELTLLRNTIYARAGNPFRKQWLHDHFAAQPWYKALPRMDKSKLSALDLANAREIVDWDNNQDEEVLRASAKRLADGAKAGRATPDEVIELRLLSARFGQWLVPANVVVAARSPIEDFRLLDRQLTAADLADLSKRDLRILRNAVYARHGYAFRSMLLSNYFGNTSWYQADPAYKPARLTALDTRNVKLIRSVEDSIGGPMTDKQHAKEDGKEDWLIMA